MGFEPVGLAEHQVDLTGQHQVAPEHLGAHPEFAHRRQLAAQGLQRRERALEERDPVHHPSMQGVVLLARESSRQYSPKRSSRSSTRPTATWAISCGSMPSRAPTWTSMAL